MLPPQLAVVRSLQHFALFSLCVCVSVFVFFIVCRGRELFGFSTIVAM